RLHFLCRLTLPHHPLPPLFPTRRSSDLISYRLALFVYWLNIFAGGALIYACWAYARRAGLVKPEAGPAVSRAITRRVLVAQSLRSEEHTSELQSRGHLVCRLLVEKRNIT